jgi:exosome complex RNA-binding protein Csl4
VWQWNVGIGGSLSSREVSVMKDFANAVRLPSGDEVIAPVTILDAQGQVVQVVAADEFRRTHPRDARARFPMAAVRRRRRDGASA